MKHAKLSQKGGGETMCLMDQLSANLFLLWLINISINMYLNLLLILFLVSKSLSADYNAHTG